MKKLLPLISAAIILTACGTETKTAQKTESAAENVTEQVTEQANDIVDENINVDDTVFFESLDEFITFSTSEEAAEDYSMALSAQAQSQNGIQSYSDEPVTFTPLIPIYNESKYEFTKIEYHQTGYSYYFKSLTADDGVRLSIKMATPYHTFEEMVESANMNLVLEVENIETTVWGNTPALVQSVQFSDPVKYSIKAMIDENNSVYMSHKNMSPEELAARLSEFTFE